MTDNLLQKLEEKMMVLLTELERLRKETQVLKQDNSLLRQEKDVYTRKLQDLISLFDSVQGVSSAA